MQNIIGRIILVFTIARDAEILDRAAGMQPTRGRAPQPISGAGASQLSSGCVEMDHLFC
jgi:hypothetical protein